MAYNDNLFITTYFLCTVKYQLYLFIYLSNAGLSIFIISLNNDNNSRSATNGEQKHISLWNSNHHCSLASQYLSVRVVLVRAEQMSRWLESIMPWLQSVQFGLHRMPMSCRCLARQSCPVTSRN